MLQRFIQLKAALRAAWNKITGQEKVPKDLRLPTDDEWMRLAALAQVLELFLRATKAVEGDGLTIPLVPSTLHDLHKALEQLGENGAKYDRAYAQTFAQALGARLHQHEIFDKPNAALLAAALHPQYSALPMCSQKVQDAVWAELEERAEKLCKKSDDSEDTMFAALSCAPREYVKVVRRRIGSLQAAAPDGPAGTDFAVNFWRTQFSKDATLRPLLCALWCTPASSAGAERLFSSLGQLHTTNQEIDTLYYWAMLRDWARTNGYNLRTLVKSIAAAAEKADKDPDVHEIV